MLYRLILIIFLSLTLLCVVAGCGESEPPLEPLQGDIYDLADDFLARLVEEDYAGAYAFFSKEIRNILSEPELKDLWLQMKEIVGSYEETTRHRHEILDGDDVITITARFSAQEMNIMLIFDDDNRISGLWLDPERRRG